MARHPFLKLSAAIIGASAIYNYLLNEEAKLAVRQSIATVGEKSHQLFKELKLIKEEFTGNSVENAQRWANEQWVKAGF